MTSSSPTSCPTSPPTCPGRPPSTAWPWPTVIASNRVEVTVGQSLAETGADAVMLLTSGSLLVVLGSVLVWAAYRRDEDDRPRAATA